MRVDVGAREDGIGNLAAGGVGEDQFAGRDRWRIVSEHFLQKGVELRSFVSDLAAGQDGCVGVQQDEERRRREELAALAQQCGQRLFDYPEFTFGAATETRWVENEAVIGTAAADFARDEGRCVVDEPADRPVRELRLRLIFTSPLDRFAGGVNVSDVRSGSSGGESCETGIAEGA